VATTIQEIHRDLMDRYCGLDYDDDYMANFSDLDTARADWTCNWWQSEPRFLSEILQQAQFEGCFIFVLVADSDGSGNPGGKYIWVKDSYEPGDVGTTLSADDYEHPISISHTDLKGLITKTTYNYFRHPAEPSKRIYSVSYSNTTARSTWNIGSLENSLSFDLEFVTGDAVYNFLSHTNPNDCIALYYDNIVADPKLVVSCRVANKAKFNLTIGDIIQFDDDNIAPYGKTWSDLYFMIVEERRTLNGLEITAREVYEA
jgi:hypothetical protein